MSTKPSTRSSTDHPFLGQEDPHFPPGVLPTRGAVLRELQFKRNLPGNSKVPYKDLASCPIISGTSDPKCKDPGGCSDRDNEKRCTFSKIQTRYSEARVPMVTAKVLVEKIKNMCEEYVKVKQRSGDKSKMNQPAVVESRNRFIKELDEIFPAYHPEAEAKILSDPSLTEEMKNSDILFLKDQMTERKFRYSGRDKNFDKIVKKQTEILKRKRDREELERSRVEKEKQRVEEASTSAVHFDLFEDNETEISVESDLSESESSALAAPEKRSRPGGGQLLFIPDNIIQLTAEAASGAEVSPKQQQKLTAAMIVACGGDIDNFFLGSTYAYTVRRDVEAEAAERYRDNFTKMCKEQNVRLVIHLDGKLSKQIDREAKKLKDRLSVVVRSPDLPHGEFLLGIPELEDGSGNEGDHSDFNDFFISYLQGFSRAMLSWN